MDALGGANPTRLRPGADCAVQGRKAQKRPTGLTGRLFTPRLSVCHGHGCEKAKSVSIIMTIERPMFPPRADNVVAFARSETKRPVLARPYVSIPETEYEPRPTRFAKNPLRKHVTMLSMAIVEANKHDQFIDRDGLDYIRKGAEFARILADELTGLAKRLEA